MNKTILQAGVFLAGIVVTALVTHYVTKGVESVEDGADALAKQEMRTIIKEELDARNQVRIEGETLTYGEALSKISSDVSKLTTTMTIVLDLPAEEESE